MPFIHTQTNARISAGQEAAIKEKLGKASFRIILTQGLNRQIRRMCEALGYQVEHLKRVRVLNIELKGMKPGTWRKVTERELEELLELTRDSRD